MYSTWVLASATYGDVARRPLYYVTLIGFAILIFCSSFLTQFAFFQEINMVREMGMASLALWAFIITVALSGTIVTQELEDRTAITLLCKPIRRSSFLLGKFFGLLMALFLGMTVLSGVLFFTVWWMSKSDLFGDPVLSSLCLRWGAPLAILGVAGAVASEMRIRGREATTAVRAPRFLLRLFLAMLVAGTTLLFLAAEFSVGTVAHADVQHSRLAREWQEGTVGEFLIAFMGRNGAIVIEGLLLQCGQTAILTAICVSLSAFVPPVVSVAGTTLTFLMGNLASYMLGSMERLGPGVSFAGRLVYYLMPNLSYFNLQTHFSEGRIISLGYMAMAISHAAIYATLVLVLSCALFERREIR